MNKSRIHNSTLNISVGLIYKIMVLVLNFVSRSIFITVLGIDYLGLNGLFTNILSVLSLAEMGVGTALIYSMYKPLAENDKTKLAALINYYKSIYIKIGIIVTVLGIAMIPFLDIILKLDKPIDNLKLYYILFLLNSVVSYFFVYRTSIVIADQKDYKLKIYQMIFSVIQVIGQIIILLTTKNYVLYLCIQIICGILVNVVSARQASKLYPYIKDNYKLEKDEKVAIWTNIKSFLYYRVGGVILNNTDNILISIIVSTSMVGFYSNYNMIIVQVAGFTSIIFSSLQASFGNLNSESNVEKSYNIFEAVNLLSFWIYGFCSVCFIVLFQDFIVLWIGDKFLLDKSVVIAAVCTFYLQGMLYPIWLYRETTGLFKYTKYTMVYASIINLVLSIVLGLKFELAGILFATVIARICTNIWFEPLKLHQIFFEKSSRGYFTKQIVNLLLLVIIITITEIISNCFILSNDIFNFILKLILCIIIPNIVFFIVFRKSREFKYICDRTLGKITKYIPIHKN